MPEHLQPPTAPTASTAPIAPDSADEDHDSLRLLSRSPHPYHRLSSELLESSARVAYNADTEADGSVPDSCGTSIHAFPSFARESPLASESGTEADDEHFLKGLPAPKTRLHKGLRGRNELLSGASTPLLSPAVLEEEGRKIHLSPSDGAFERDKRSPAERIRRRKELVRRGTEVLLLLCQGGMVATNPQVRPFLRMHQRGKFAVDGFADLRLIKLS
jgi:hypothetical protein